MLSALKLLWGSTGGKITTIIFAVAFAVSVAFAYSHGHSSGYASGFTGGQKSRDAEVKDLGDKVTKLTEIINDDRKAQSKKIEDVQKDAANAAVATEKKLGQQVRERDAIIRNYQKTTSTVIQESCGLSLETVRAINLLIDNANEKAVPVDLPAPTPADSSPNSPDPGSKSGSATPGDTDVLIYTIGDGNEQFA